MQLYLKLRKFRFSNYFLQKSVKIVKGYSLIPMQDVWFDIVCLNFDPFVNGNDSAANFILLVLPAVNITEYSFEFVLSQFNISILLSSTIFVDFWLLVLWLSI